MAAQEKAAELAERFADWAWEDPARAGGTGPHLQRPVQQPGAAQLRRRHAVAARPGPDVPAPGAPGRGRRPDDPRARRAAGARGRGGENRRDDHGRHRTAAARPDPQARGRRPEPHARAIRPGMAPALPAGQGDDRRAGGSPAGPAPRIRGPLRHRHLGRHRHVPVGVRAHPAQRRTSSRTTWTANSRRCGGGSTRRKAATASRSRSWKRRCCGPRNGSRPSSTRPRTRASRSRRPGSTTCASTRPTGTRTCAPPPTSATRRSTGRCGPPTWT